MKMMNLDEMLIYADIDQINKIAENYYCQCDRHSKKDLIQTIIYTIFNKETLEKLIFQLDDIHFTYIQLLYLDSRNQYTIEDLLAKGKQAIDLHKAAIKPRELVLSALKKGWVFHGVGKKHLLVYLVPQDFKKEILQSISNKLESTLRLLNNINFYRDEKKLLISDLATFLNFVSNEEVILTGNGSIYKRLQNALFKSFHVEEEPIKKTAWRFGYGRRYNDYPDRFSLIYDFAYYNKFIRENEHGFLRTTQTGEHWNPKDSLQDEFKLYQFWIRLYKFSIPFLQVIVKLIDLTSFPNWVELEKLENLILFWINDHYYEKKEQIFRERIIKMLLHLGVIQISVENEKTYVQVTDEGHLWINGFTSFDVKEIIFQDRNYRK